MALITITQQQLIKAISPNWATSAKVAGGRTNFDTLTDEVENTDLARMLGNELLYDIHQNPTDAKYVNLLDGYEFTTDNGNTLKFRGIRHQLAYLNFSKAVDVSHIADTFTGFVSRQRTESETISAGDRKRVQTDARNIAEQDFAIMKIYLNQNTATYPLWSCSDTKKSNLPRFTGIKKTYK